MYDVSISIEAAVVVIDVISIQFWFPNAFTFAPIYIDISTLIQFLYEQDDILLYRGRCADTFLIYIHDNV